ncbi:MAG: hypothetical protein Q8J99_05350 [Sulfuritalea sp.]|nr:hypothetical protein [Sulfuritalea sp.]
MKYVLSIFLGVFLTAASVRAQTTDVPPAGVGFDCWVGHDGKPFFTNYIRCIADRDLPHPELVNQQSETFLHLLHQELHAKSGADAEAMMKANIELVRETRSIWNIRIHSYPYEWSWREGRPEQLVRAVLCPADLPCTVLVRPR